MNVWIFDVLLSGHLDSFCVLFNTVDNISFSTVDDISFSAMDHVLFSPMDYVLFNALESMELLRGALLCIDTLVFKYIWEVDS